MTNDKKFLADFIQEGRFELNSYITSLFSKINEMDPNNIADELTSNQNLAEG